MGDMIQESTEKYGSSAQVTLRLDPTAKLSGSSTASNGSLYTHLKMSASRLADFFVEDCL